MVQQYKGASRKYEVKANRRRKDTRTFSQKWSDFFNGGDGAVAGLFILPCLSLVLIKVPLAGELLFLFTILYGRQYIRIDNRAWDFPYRAPKVAQIRDGSIRGGKELGKGIAYLGNDLETKEQIYAGDSDLRTHMLVLGTTGSGKTEFLLGLVFNALIQNTGFIFCDGKGDPKLQKEIFRLARYLGREDDLLIINFITSGRDLIDDQGDKITNTMNMFGNTSSGMLVELIVSLMDDSGGSGDMWKGRAISFVAALTRPLSYMRDKGFINLSSEKYLENFELSALEELVFEHNGKYGDKFDVIVAPLRSYLLTLPGYQKSKIKKQETKTLEQHGFIVMQLTRIFNDLSFNYGHIFKTKVGDVDFFDVVVNRRLLVVLLPALERAPDSMRMLGKMIVGSIKQMMAGCLGNRVEGVVREIIDSRPTNAPVPFYAILDEYGYYSVVGFAVAPAQARSLGFSVIFAAQDFSSLKKSSSEEADATFENTNIRAVGRITSGQESETWKRIQGASGQADESRITGFERKSGAVDEKFSQQDNVSIESRSRLDYDDLASQENGDFTFIIGKKEQGGKAGGVRVTRGVGFYTAGKTPKVMRINDLLPVEPPEPADLPQNQMCLKKFSKAFDEGLIPGMIRQTAKPDAVLKKLDRAFQLNYLNQDRPALARQDIALAALSLYLNDELDQLNEGTTVAGGSTESAPRESSQTVSDPLGLQESAITKALMGVADTVLTPKVTQEGYIGAVPVAPDDDFEISVNTELVTTNLVLAEEDSQSFKAKALPILRQHLYMLDDIGSEDEWESQLSVADRDQLLAMEVAAGTPFETLEDKWAIEDRITSTRGVIARETSYIDPPEPNHLSVEDLTSRLRALNGACSDTMKSRLKEDVRN